MYIKHVDISREKDEKRGYLEISYFCNISCYFDAQQVQFLIWIRTMSIISKKRRRGGDTERDDKMDKEMDDDKAKERTTKRDNKW